MKLEPVYLLAPLPQPAMMRSRRAFLGMGAMFVGGCALGSACGYSMGRAAAAPAEPVDELAPSGDPDLDELRRLAVKAPIEELMGRAEAFSLEVDRTYRQDVVAWKGIGRIADHLVAESARDRRALAKWIAQVIENAVPDRHAEYERWIPLLRGIK